MEKGKMKLSTPSKKEIEAIKATAKKTLVKDSKIAIRLYDHDYRGIQKKAMEMGIPLPNPYFRHNPSIHRGRTDHKNGITIGRSGTGGLELSLSLRCAMGIRS